MSEIIVKPIGNTKSEVKEFVKMAPPLYKDYLNYVTPILSDQVKMIMSGPFEKIGEKQLFIAYKDDKPVGRISAHRSFSHNEHYKENQGFFGWFESIDDVEVANKLTEEAESWLKEKGCTDMLGPINFTIYDEIGMLIDAFDLDPIILCTYNPPYYPRLLEKLGYKKEIDWFAYLKNGADPIPPTMEKIAKRIEKRGDYVLRYASKKNWEHEVSTIKEIFEEAWAENWGNVPFTDEHWHHVTAELKLILKEELVIIIEVDGKPVGFSVSVPDANYAIKKAKGKLFPFGIFKMLFALKKIKRIRTTIMGVRKEYRKRGFDILMIYKTIQNGVALGYQDSDCSLIVESNDRMVSGVEGIGAKKYKTYRIFRKTFS